MKIYRSTGSRIDFEASAWVARLGNTDPAGASQREREFASWLQQSAAHVRAFLEASDAFYRLDRLTSNLTADTRQLIGNASSNVAALPSPAPGSARSPHVTRRTW